MWQRHQLEPVQPRRSNCLPEVLVAVVAAKHELSSVTSNWVVLNSALDLRNTYRLLNVSNLPLNSTLQKRRFVFRKTRLRNNVALVTDCVSQFCRTGLRLHRHIFISKINTGDTHTAIDRPGRCALCLSQLSHRGRPARLSFTTNFSVYHVGKLCVWSKNGCHFLEFFSL